MSMGTGREREGRGCGDGGGGGAGGWVSQEEGGWVKEGEGRLLVSFPLQNGMELYLLGLAHSSQASSASRYTCRTGKPIQVL